MVAPSVNQDAFDDAFHDPSMLTTTRNVPLDAGNPGDQDEADNDTTGGKPGWVTVNVLVTAGLPDVVVNVNVAVRGVIR